MEAALPRPIVATPRPVVTPATDATALDSLMPMLFLGSYAFAVVFLVATGLSLV
ncbi:MAG: hypothetical protein ACI8RZ_007120 [Myxococcota bacterium]|jgi:hypothetical protein